MLFGALLKLILFSSVICFDENKTQKPYVVFPMPLELPNRNDRAIQCWLRIEDFELVETVAVYCNIAQAFIRSHIRDYNFKKMSDDDVEVSVWSEEPRTQEDVVLKVPENSQNNFKDWKETTVLDPITRMRIYVTKQADCKLIMYSREGVTNYKVDCDKILYFVNDRMTSAGTSVDFGRLKSLSILFIGLLLVIN